MKNNGKKILGLILELNPPHNGHKYFIDKAKELVNPDYTIAVLSSSFTMRGEISIINKWDKAKIALKLGIDLVFELPFLSAINSADFFASNAVNILNNLNVTDIAFGCELDNLDKLQEIKKIITSFEFNSNLKQFLNKGLSYTGSNLKALTLSTKDEEILNNYSLPNNMLALNYLKAFDHINYHPKITLIKRIENNYFDNFTTGNISSASSIRKSLQDGKNIKSFIPFTFTNIDENMAYNEMYKMIKYFLLTSSKEEIKNIFGVYEGIENRLIDNIIYNDYYEFINHVQTKRYPINKIKRLLLHLLMQTPKKYEDHDNYYLRLLALSEKGKNHLRTLDEETKKSIITSFKETQNDIALFELKVSKIYSLITNKSELYLEEFKVPYKGEKE